MFAVMSGISLKAKPHFELWIIYSGNEHSYLEDNLDIVSLLELLVGS
jgi:hypothetical protein